MAHRGPDDEGVSLAPNGRVDLANRRLAIRDLSAAGHMPMATEDDLVWITYTGEIYNADDLRREFTALGYGFRSQSDTEVILQAYATWGAASVTRLRGMFALAVLDRRPRAVTTRVPGISNTRTGKWKVMQMKALVTGGAGFIGSNIVQKLVQLGHEPVVIDNFASGYPENLVAGVRVIEGDIRDSIALHRAIDGTEVVFHLAASVGNARSIEHPLEDADVNILGTLSVLEAARAQNIDKVIFSSSAGIFGELKTLPIAEDHPQDPDSPYGVSKLAAEKCCLVYNKLYGMRNVCLRYFNVYGQLQRYDAYGNVIPIFAHRILTGQPLTIFGDGEQTRDFVEVRDVAMANINAALDAKSAGVFNIGSGTRISVNKLAYLLQDTVATSISIEYGPQRSGDVRHSLADTSAAAIAFGYAPSIRIEEGIRQYMSWIRQDTITLQQLQAEFHPRP